MSINQAEVEDALDRSGFERTNETGRTVEYRSLSNGKFLYFRTTIGLTGYIRLVVHPQVDLAPLLVVEGVTVNSRKELQHGDHMTRFPKRKNKGRKEVHFGRALNIASVTAISPFAAAFHGL